MTYLLDTHTLILAVQDSKQLSPRARKAIANLDNKCFYSIVSLWEITIKYNLGALDLKMSLKELFDIVSRSEFDELAIEQLHLLELSNLPQIHKDPFDRLLIAQAKHQGLVLVTRDSEIPKYDVEVLW
jgi:PIN domain nuclease of toxin-antitoxin system